MDHGHTCQRCGAKLRIRSSRKIALLYRTYYMQCTNAECDARYRVDAAVTRHDLDALVVTLHDAIYREYEYSLHSRYPKLRRKLLRQIAHRISIDPGARRRIALHCKIDEQLLGEVLREKGAQFRLDNLIDIAEIAGLEVTLNIHAPTKNAVPAANQSMIGQAC